MKVQTKVKAGVIAFNHNEKLVRGLKKTPAPKAKGLKVKTSVKAGVRLRGNHNEQLVRAGR